MNWKKSLEGGLVAAIASILTLIAPLLSDGKVTGAELTSLVVTFFSVFLAYLKTHLPVDGPQ